MAEDSVLNNILSEFKAWGLPKPIIENTNGGHIRLRWRVSPDKEVRTTVLPKTGSDWRGWLNQRANVRALFKQDGLIDPRERVIEKKKEPLLKKALSTPSAPPERLEEQVAYMRSEIADLTEFALDVHGMLLDLMSLVKERLASPITMSTMLPTPPAPEPVPLPGRRPNTRGQKVIDYLSFNWNSLDAICRDMGLPKDVVKRKLVYLTKDNKVEFQAGGLWRKTPPPAPKKPAKKVAAKTSKKANGIHRANGRKHQRVMHA